ncbi:cyclophilin A [Mycena galericulata]|nr:cyclophilin A [Mycena galericulata]
MLQQTWIVDEHSSLPAGRIVFKLYDDVVPKTADNFRKLAQGLNANESRRARHAHAGSGFHRVIPSFMLQGGDFTNHDGTCGVSIYGAKFKGASCISILLICALEGILGAHQAGLLSMVNAGPNTNGSQFFITTVVTSWLDGKHVVFGGVVEKTTSWSRRSEGYGSQTGKPFMKTTIEAPGVIE